MTLKTGLIGILNQQLKDDLRGMAHRLREWGFDGIESPAGLAEAAGMTPAELLEVLRNAGLEVPVQGKISIWLSDDEVRSTAAAAAAVGAAYAAAYYGPVESREQLLRDAEHYDRIGKICREEGVGFCYHNHDHEFQLFNGHYAMEILLDNTDPELVKAELDVAWCNFGGADPVAFLTKYSGRCPVLHMKDFKELLPGCIHAGAERKDARFTEVGEGVVNIRGVVRAAKACGVRWLVAEQDRMGDLEPVESARLSCRNLRRMLEKAYC